MSDCSTHAFDVPLKPCPFCGGEADEYEGDYGNGIYCMMCGAMMGEPIHLEYMTTNRVSIAEAIAAWNSRTPIEYDGWFYLPKPKEGIVQYGAPNVEEVENGYKIKQPVEVIESAIRSWGDELGDYVMKRICEAWNSRAERTCHIEERYGDWYCTKCGDMVGTCDPASELYIDGNAIELWNYCPNCGKAVER